MGGEDLACLEVDDGHGGLVGGGQDAGAAVGVADAEVVHLAGAAEADLAPGVDVVLADPTVLEESAAARWLGLGKRGVSGLVEVPGRWRKARVARTRTAAVWCHHRIGWRAKRCANSRAHNQAAGRAHRAAKSTAIRIATNRAARAAKRAAVSRATTVAGSKPITEEDRATHLERAEARAQADLDLQLAAMEA